MSISVKISAEITLNKNLKWPKYGAKYIVSCVLFLLGWGLFGYYGIIAMAATLKMSMFSKELIIVQIGSMLSLDKYLNIPIPHNYYVVSSLLLQLSEID